MAVNNFRLVDVRSVMVGLPHKSDGKLAVRGLARSRLIAADVNFGFKQANCLPELPKWQEAYAIGVHFNDERSEVHVDGRTYTHPYRSGQTHFLYLSDLAHIDFTTRRHTLEVVVQRSLLREICDDLELPHSTFLGTSLYHMADDPVLRRLAVRIYPLFDAPDTVDPLFADHFMWSLGTYLMGHYGGLVVRRPITGGLSTWQERLAKEVIEFNLVDGIGLTELAALCGLGTSQFSHAFKRSTGVAPYQWLLRRRLARARVLMMNRSRALADIALDSGFADQSHLTRSFARHFGVTPGALRATLH